MSAPAHPRVLTRRGRRWELGTHLLRTRPRSGWRLRELPVVLHFEHNADWPGEDHRGRWVLYLYGARVYVVDHLLDPAMSQIEQRSFRILSNYWDGYRPSDPSERVLESLLDSGFEGTVLEVSDAVTAIVRDRPRF